ncbi:metal ABC transporter substrate-binding protein [Gemmatimonadota bacterium]
MPIRKTLGLALALAIFLAPMGAEGQQERHSRRQRRGTADMVRVVTTQPPYATFAKAIGGPLVSVLSISSPAQNPHTVRPKPSYAMEVRQADLFVNTGLDMELWVPTLLDRAGNRQVMEGGRGYVTAYTGVRLVDIPASTDRSQGEIHLYGNPHFHSDPLRALQVARNITVGLKRVAPELTAEFDAGFADFQDRVHRRLFGDELVDMLGGETLERMAYGGNLLSFLEENELEGTPLISWLGGWMKATEQLRGRDLICYHKNWQYFEERFGVRCAEFVETKPGIPPTPAHVAHLLDLMEERNLRVILAADYFDRNKVESVARRAGAISVMLPLALPVTEGAQEYFEVVDLWISRLVDAFESADSLTAEEE